MRIGTAGPQITESSAVRKIQTEIQSSYRLPQKEYYVKCVMQSVEVLDN